MARHRPMENWSYGEGTAMVILEFKLDFSCTISQELYGRISRLPSPETISLAYGFFFYHDRDAFPSLNSLATVAIRAYPVIAAVPDRLNAN